MNCTNFLELFFHIDFAGFNFTAKHAKILCLEDFIKTQSSQSFVLNQLCELCVLESQADTKTLRALR
ncbi:hypothetical protein [Flavobacterium aquidurense]|uniref:hypothetical protein n=1 Tax=Flavobacterium aquidurense TaxID=362413 RepID=UPI003723CA08